MLVGDTLFGCCPRKRRSGQFFALDAKTGEEKVLWLESTRAATSTAVGGAGSLLFFLKNDAAG